MFFHNERKWSKEAAILMDDWNICCYMNGKV